MGMDLLLTLAFPLLRKANLYSHSGSSAEGSGKYKEMGEKRCWINGYRLQGVPCQFATSARRPLKAANLPSLTSGVPLYGAKFVYRVALQI